MYSSVHRGAGFKSRLATAAYESARASRPRLRRPSRDGDDIAILCRNTTEASTISPTGCGSSPTTSCSPRWSSTTPTCCPGRGWPRRRYVECGPDGTFETDDVVAGARRQPAPRGCSPSPAPPTSPVAAPARRDRGRRPRARGPRLARRRPARPPPAPPGRRPTIVAFSGHKMYAPFGAGVLVGPRPTFADGDPFLAGGGAVDLVDLDEVVWTEPPEREEAGSPNVVGAVALGAALDQLGRIGWDAIAAHERGAGRLGSAAGWPPSTACACSARRSTPTPCPRHLRRRGRPPRPGGGPAVGRVGHRRPPRVLLRPPLSDPAPGLAARRDRRLPRAGPARRPPPHARGGAGQLRDLEHRGRCRRAARGGGPHRHRGAVRDRDGGAVRPRRRHRRLLARERRAGVAGPRARDGRVVRPGLRAAPRGKVSLSPWSRGRGPRS